MNIEGQLWGHPVTSSMTSSSWKILFSIIWDDIFISDFKLKLCLIFEKNQNGRHFELATIFFYRKWYRKLIIPERWPLAFPTFCDFDGHCSPNIDGDISIYKIWPTLWSCDVINDVMSAWNIRCTIRHPQQCTCKILFVWHQSFIVKSIGQTSWQT